MEGGGLGRTSEKVSVSGVEGLCLGLCFPVVWGWIALKKAPEPSIPQLSTMPSVLRPKKSVETVETRNPLAALRQGRGTSHSGGAFSSEKDKKKAGVGWGGGEMQEEHWSKSLGNGLGWSVSWSRKRIYSSRKHLLGAWYFQALPWGLERKNLS